MERLVSSTAWDQNLLFFVTQTDSFLLFFHYFLEDLRSHQGQRDPSNPAGHCTYVLSSEDFGNTTKRPLGLLCATSFFFFFRMCVRVCVITYAWLREGVKLDSKILYNTAYICHGRELPHELNRDKEQIYLK